MKNRLRQMAGNRSLFRKAKEQTKYGAGKDPAGRAEETKSAGKAEQEASSGVYRKQHGGNQLERQGGIGMKIWKRNAVVATIVLFVCVAVYLNWSYGRGQEAGELVSAKETLSAVTTTPAASPSANANAAENENAKENENESNASTGGEASGKVLGQPVLVDSADSGKLTETSGTNSNANASGSAYFANARLTRQQARDSALELLQKTVDDKSADQKAKDMATESIKAMAAYTLTESRIENLVTAKGYVDCVAYIGDGGISIVASNGGKGFKATDAAVIADIVTAETTFTPSQIKIIEAK